MARCRARLGREGALRVWRSVQFVAVPRKLIADSSYTHSVRISAAFKRSTCCSTRGKSSATSRSLPARAACSASNASARKPWAETVAAAPLSVWACRRVRLHRHPQDAFAGCPTLGECPREIVARPSPPEFGPPSCASIARLDRTRPRCPSPEPRLDFPLRRVPARRAIFSGSPSLER